jgi:octaprenyl-diphosphate synthase
MNVQTIFSDYSKALKDVEKELSGIFKSGNLLIPLIGKHIMQSGGKRIRPLFLLLSADLCKYKGESHSLLAAIIEAIHTASLLHDDVIDAAETRRGKPTAHGIWGNQIAILVGDYLYSNALRLAVNQKSQKIMEALSEATTKMTEGEVLQLSKIGDPEISQEEYFEIISAKTGCLISAACRIGGIIAGVNGEKESALSRFGMKTGIAFQLADDILDYVADQKEIGKRLGKDLEEGKITMPLIFLLRAASKKEKTEIKNIIKEHGTKKHGLKNILGLFEKYKVIEESMKVAGALIEEAKSELAVFPQSKEKDALIAMAGYAMQREK